MIQALPMLARGALVRAGASHAVSGIASSSGQGAGPIPSPNPGLEFDAESYMRRVYQFATVTNREVGGVIRDEARLLVKACMERTPPFSGRQLQRMGVSKTADGTARQIGERAVARDIRRVFRPVSGLDLYKQNEGFRTYADDHDIYGIRGFLKGAKNFHAVAVSPDPRHHRSQRTSRGRVRKRPLWDAILHASAVDNYIKTRQRKVGFARAGWKRAAQLFGASMAGWMLRHSAPGHAQDKTRNTAQPEAQAANGVPFIQWAEGKFSVVRGALRERERALRAKIHRAVTESFHRKASTKGAAT